MFLMFSVMEHGEIYNSVQLHFGKCENFPLRTLFVSKLCRKIDDLIQQNVFKL